MRLFVRWFGSRKVPSDEEIGEEIRHHLDLEERLRVERGSRPEDAHCDAAREFGNELLVAETTRGMWTGGVWGGLGQDLRQAFRSLQQNPWVALLAVLTLAVGIAFNTAIFSVAYHVLLRPLPYPEPDRLVWINEVAGTDLLLSDSYPGYKDRKARATSYAAMGAVVRAPMALTGDANAAQLTGRLASSDFLPMLGVKAALGRLFTPEEDRPGAAAVVVLGHSAWQTHLGAEAGIIGQAIRLNGRLRTVIGVLPKEFAFYRGSEDFYLPLATVEDESRAFLDRGNRLGLQVLGRLRPEVSEEQALSEMKQISAGLTAQYPQYERAQSVRLLPFAESVRKRLRPVLRILLAFVGLVLLIACGNVSNLLLVRVVERQREISVRAALGASRWRIVRQLLCESLMLAGAAGLVGTLGAYMLFGWLRPLIPTSYEIFREAQINLPVMAFTLVLAGAAALLFGILPALHSTRTRMPAGLTSGGRSYTGSAGARRFRRGLLVVEIGLAVLLATGSVLLLRSFANLLNVDPGFQTEKLLTAELRLTKQDGNESAARRLMDGLGTEMESLPGVVGASSVMCLPVDGGCWRSVLEVKAKLTSNRSKLPSTQFNVAGPRYFEVMGIPLLAGRSFEPGDGPDAPKVAMVNQAAASYLFGDENPIGRHVRQGWAEKGGPWREIVGVVGNVLQSGPGGQASPEVFLPFAQESGRGLMWPVVRTSVDPLSLAPALRDAVRRLNPEVPVHNVKTMDSRLTDSMETRRFLLVLIGVFSTVAVALAAVGLFGSIEYGARQRRREFAVRLALGAAPIRILRGVLTEAVLIAAAGVAFGCASAAGSVRLVRSMLFGVQPFDPLTVGLVSAGTLVVGVTAAALPAWRASRLSPSESLRHE
ncbi:MAG: ABC transporter permease [Bryobacteraceae bacterium]|nr:ABC transporter permease [Bryobacteraceae bacterium]